MLAVPAGIYHWAETGRQLNAVQLFARGRWGAPALHLAGQPKPVVATRWCPRLFALPEADARALTAIDLPYRMVLAVATLDSVFLYDTVSSAPLAALCALHYDSITDLAWSDDARFLVVASRDCYCSVVAFEEGELGQALSPEQEAAFLPRTGPHLRGAPAGVKSEAGLGGADAPHVQAAAQEGAVGEPQEAAGRHQGGVTGEFAPEASPPPAAQPSTDRPGKPRRIEAQPLSPGSAAPRAAPFISPPPSAPSKDSCPEAASEPAPKRRVVVPTPIGPVDTLTAASFASAAQVR